MKRLFALARRFGIKILEAPELPRLRAQGD
jgi:hypothetical protein